MRLAFVWPRPDPHAAALGPASGGYAYDEALVAALRARGVEVSVVETDGSVGLATMSGASWGSPVPAERAPELAARGAPAVEGAGGLPTLCASQPSALGSADTASPAALASASAIIVDGLAAPQVVPGLRALKGLKVGLVHMAPVPQDFLDALDVALFVSESVLVEVRGERRLPARVAVAAPGVDHFPRRARLPAAHFVSVAHVLPHKGALEALEVFGALRDAQPSLQWTASWLGALDVDRAYGDEVLARTAALGLRERVRFTGRVAREQVAEALAGSAALVSTSVSESWGLGAAEALSLGVPLVSWTRGGVFAQAREGGAGAFVKPGDFRGMAQALEVLLTDAAARARMDDAARTVGASLPTWDQCARAVLTACG